MPSDQLDETITITCQVCQIAFHPRTGYAKHTKLPRTCSSSCAQRLRLRSRLGIPLEEIPQKGTKRECPQCRQDFIPKKRRQQYCSHLCQSGAALSRIKNAHSQESRETLRQIQLQRVADGTHNFLSSNTRRRSRTTLSDSKRTVKPHQSRATRVTTPRVPSTSVSPEDTPVTMSAMFPPLPDIPEADTELESPVISSDVWASGSSLSFPLLGRAAQDEWRTAGEQREAQADKKLAREEAQTAEGRTVILAGQGSYLGVENGALLAHQGRTHGVPAPEKEFFYPAVHNVRRIIWIGAHGHLTGTMTLAAAVWCRSENIHLCVLDGSGFPLLEVLPATHQDAELRRRQWLISSGIVLPGSLHAGAIVRAIVRRKVEGQCQTLTKHPELPGHESTLSMFRDWQQWLALEQPTTPQQDIGYLMRLEGRLAGIYFRAWDGWALTWSKPDQRRIPPHWLTARVRFSPLAPHGDARHAIDPVNACLNYCYACLASQCRQSLYQEGFDVAGGFLHADKPGRDSLTYDLMELERGAVDDLLLTFLGKTVLHYGDFARHQDGSILLNSQLTRLLLAECRVPQSRIDGHAKMLKRWLLQGAGNGEGSLARDSGDAEPM